MSAIREGAPPDGWRWARLGEVATFYHGGTPSKARPEFWNGHIPWVSPKDMRRAHISDAEDRITAAGVAASATRVVEPGTILIVARSGILARTLPVAITDAAVAFNQDIKAIVPSKQLNAQFASYILRAHESYILREGVKKGATVHSLKSGFIESFVFPLPSMPEQRRIADRLDAAIEQLERARDLAKAQLAAFESLQVTLLHAAFRGEL